MKLTYEENEDQWELIPSDKPYISLTDIPSSAIMYGEENAVEISVYSLNLTDAISVNTSDSDVAVAEYNDGIITVTGIGSGTAQINVSSGTAQSSFTINVVGNPNSISAAANSITVEAGETKGVVIN